MKTIFAQIFDAIAFAVAVLTAISAPILIVLYVLAESERGPIRWNEGAFHLLWSLGGFCVAVACPVACAASIYLLVRNYRREKRSAARTFVL